MLLFKFFYLGKIPLLEVELIEKVEEEKLEELPNCVQINLSKSKCTHINYICDKKIIEECILNNRLVTIII